ncbi:MAG TPA: phospholipase [Thermoanaerobaculia bacterium]|nr:phospholipase [Thermoanaerobaculia bacterium]
MKIQTIETSVHGRYLYEDRGTERLLVGFHGYGEDATAHLAELERIPGVERWSVVAVQALHPFYTRTQSIVASWMTGLDREVAIADNIAYVRRILAALPPPRTLVFAGFSQGAAMAARAAAYAAKPAGLILLGGDIPPEIHADPGVTLPPVLLGRGTRDEWYSEEKLNKDLSYLEATTRVTRCVFEGGHEWTDPFRTAAGELLRSLDA